MTGVTELVIWRIDADDCILETNEAFRRFARENGTPHLAEDLSGQNLWDHVTGDDVRHLYELILQRSRRSRTPFSFDYRCDSPVLRRYLRLTLTSRPDGGIVFESSIVREEPCDAVELLDPTQPRGLDLVRICSWCKKVKVGDDWVAVEEAVGRLGVFESDYLPALTHGICIACERSIDDELHRHGRI